MKKNLWMMAAMLICGVMMTLTSCSKDDDNNEPKLVSPGPMAEKVSGGAWYDVYEASGTAKEEGSSDAETVSYSVVICSCSTLHNGQLTIGLVPDGIPSMA